MFRVASKFISNSYVKFALYFAIGATILPFACDVFWQPLLQRCTNNLAARLAHQYGAQVGLRSVAIACLAQYRLAWIYCTKDGVVQGEGIAPELHQFSEGSREIGYDSQPYYEAVVPLANDQFFHVGVSESPLTDQLLASIRLKEPWLLSLPLGYVMIDLTLVFLVTAIFFNRAIMVPLRRLSDYANFLLKGDAELAEIDIGGSPEITKLGESIQQIKSAFNQISYERLTTEHQLRKKQRELEAEKSSIASEYQHQVAEVGRSITEFQAKESEEEFLSSLARELDAMTSLNRACNLALERLNNKFPTSLIAGAFFVAGPGNRLKVEAVVGLNQKDRDMLNSLDYQPLLSELLTDKRYMLIEQRQFNHYGLSAMATADLHMAIYLPVTFQQRNIGVLAFFGTEPRQNIQERVRVLRNAAELCSRALRLLLYREELQAARTDALTGLYDKKFVCNLFERAASNSAGHSTSIMMIDCDQLKSIDSTHGADVRDQVMKELAQSVRKFTRMREIGTEAGRPSDYVIRFGTQQILVILEKTHASRAMLVAKRLSRIIGRKADWLGGISTLSVSVGVSTYPEDATDVSELISNTTLALRYAQTQLGLNAVCHSSQVPKNFLSSEEALINPVQVPNVVIESIPVASNIGCEVIVDRRKSERRKRPLKG